MQKFFFFLNGCRSLWISKQRCLSAQRGIKKFANLPKPSHHRKGSSRQLHSSIHEHLPSPGHTDGIHHSLVTSNQSKLTKLKTRYRFKQTHAQSTTSKSRDADTTQKVIKRMHKLKCKQVHFRAEHCMLLDRGWVFHVEHADGRNYTRQTISASQPPRM